MRSPGRGRGGRGTGDGASAFRDGVATIPVVGLRMRLSVRHYECRYAKADRNTQSGGEQRNPHLEIWPHLAILLRVGFSLDLI